jgi:long-chain acyl-CoA synthetase
MHGDDFVLHRSVSDISDVHVRFIQDKIDTMEKVFRFAVRQHGQKAAVGTREILAEEDEIQSNGRIFKKVLHFLSDNKLFSALITCFLF